MRRRDEPPTTTPATTIGRQQQEKHNPQQQSPSVSNFQAKLANLLKKGGGGEPGGIFQETTKMVLAGGGTHPPRRGDHRDRSPRMMPLIRENIGLASATAISPRPVDPAEPSTSSASSPSTRPTILGGTTTPSPLGAPRPSLFDLPPASPFLGPHSSPVPSPQWRMPAGTGGSGGRTMPKSALLMSKCQAFLKSGNLAEPPPSPFTPLEKASERGASSHREEQQPASRTIGSSLDFGLILQQRSHHQQRREPTEIVAQKAVGKTNGSSPMDPPSSAECIFNFEDVFFEGEDENGEAEVEEVLRWREVREHIVERRRSRSGRKCEEEARRMGGGGEEPMDEGGRGWKNVAEDDGKMEEEELAGRRDAEDVEGMEEEGGGRSDRKMEEEKREEGRLMEEQEMREEPTMEEEEGKGEMPLGMPLESPEQMDVEEQLDLLGRSSENMGKNVEKSSDEEEEEEKEKRSEKPREESPPLLLLTTADCQFHFSAGQDHILQEAFCWPIPTSERCSFHIVEKKKEEDGNKQKEEETEGPETIREAGGPKDGPSSEGAANGGEGRKSAKHLEWPEMCERRELAKDGGGKREEERQPIENMEETAEEAKPEESVGHAAKEMTGNGLEEMEEDGEESKGREENDQKDAGRGMRPPERGMEEEGTKEEEAGEGEKMNGTAKEPAKERELAGKAGGAAPHDGKRGGGSGRRRAGPALLPLPITAEGAATISPPSPAGSPTCSLGSSSALPSCSSFTSARAGPGAPNSPQPPPSSSAASRVVERLRIGGMQLRNMHCAQNGAQLVVGIRLDGREVFRTAAVQLSGNSCVIGEEFSMEEVPRHFHTLQLNLFELVDGARQQRLLGRVKLGRREMVEAGDALQERWLPIGRVRPTDFTQVLGSLCVDIGWEPLTKMLTLRVLDLTAWTLSGDHENPLERHSREGGGRLQLKLCLAFGRSAFSAMQKIRLSERRGLEQARFDCTPFFPSSTPFSPEKPPHSPRAAAADFSAGEWASGLSACSSPACTPSSWTPASKGGAGGHSSRHSSRQFHFPPPSPGVGLTKGQQPARQMPGAKSGGGDALGAHLDEPRVHIKVYGGGGGQETYCGSVRIPLDPEQQMQPRDGTRGPNWFNIRSKTTTATKTTTQFKSGKSDSSSKRLTPAPFPSNNPITSASSPLVHSQQVFLPHHQKRFSQPPPSSPSLYRHCSTPSTSSIVTTGAAPRPVVNTRSQPLKTPSITSLFSSSGGASGNGPSSARNGPILQSKKSHNNNNSQLEIHQRRSLGDSDIINMNMAQHSAENFGEIRLKFWYNMDEVLPMVHYQPLYMNLIRSLNFTPYSHSLISLIQCLPIDIENLAKPLMKIFIHSNQIRPFFRLICSEYVSSCSDVNTLFRSQSLASKVMYEMMKFVGHKYLVASLKPLIDLIYAERKSCEIDPSKLKAGDSLEQNFRNITVYAELAFGRVIDSRHRCPLALRELFAELRAVVEHHFPGRDDVARLALSSFLIMRFFAAAILNPKLFSLKLETPDMDVSRTLVLVSKILQRLANCVVSAHPLTTKEQWLAPVLHRFSDDAHKMSMINFLDQISAPIKSGAGKSGRGGFHAAPEDEECLLVNNENALPTTPTSPPFSPFGEPQVLKSGYLIERRFGPVKKRSFKNFIHPKRRLVVLTESMLNWQKTNSKESINASMANALNAAAAAADHHQQQHFSFGSSIGEQQKSQIPLAEVTSVGAIMDAKNSFRVATVATEVHFQAGSEADMNEWIILIQKQQRRHLMHLNRPLDYSASQMSTVQQAAAEVDIERELHSVYTQLADHLDALCKYGWCCRHGCPRCGQGGGGGEDDNGMLPPSFAIDADQPPPFQTHRQLHHRRE